MQTCRESKRDGGLVYVCVVVVGGAVKGNSEARNGICYWDYRTTSSPSQTIATVITLNIGTPRPATVVVLNIKQFNFTLKSCLQKM